MSAREDFSFPPFRLDPANEQLWDDNQLVPLRPKLFAILHYLVAHAGRLVSREELRKAVWADTIVSEGILRGCIRELREALRDDPDEPQFIETVARRGHRFIAPLSTAAPVQSLKSKVQSSPQSPNIQRLVPTLVGRETELTQLHQWWEKAASGERQIVFVTGEPGIGKTTLVETFLQSLASGAWSRESQNDSIQPSELLTLNSRRQTPNAPVWIGRGQCVEHYGAGEAYLPVLEALGRLCRGPDGERLIELLRQHAPTWLAQMPALLQEAELEAVQRKIQGVTRERMLREFAEAIEVMTAETPLVLLLEDLHWSDYATIDLLSVLARRREAARLLVLGTYRPADVVISGRPLKAAKQELQTHRQCEELSLGFLTATAVAQYLTGRFPHHQFPPQLTELIHNSTDGNPLFMVNTVDYLVARGTVSDQDGQWQLCAKVADVALGVPENLRQMIEKQIEQLTAQEQRILEVASVAGAEFSAAVLNAGAGDDHEGEEQCEALVRRGQFLRTRGVAEWPDGTIAARYGFIHALYHQVLYERVPVGRRMRLHRQIGVRQEGGYGARAGEIASELSVHFEQGKDYRRAVHYHELAARRALQRSTPQEAINHLIAGLSLLQHLPDTTERRSQQELTLQTALGGALAMTKGFAAQEVERAYARARVLCQQIGETPQIFPVLLGLGRFYVSRGELRIAHELAEQLFSPVQHGRAPGLLLEGEAPLLLGSIDFWLGDFVAAHALLEQSIALAGTPAHHSSVVRYGNDPRIVSRLYAALAFWALGYADQALEHIWEGLSRASAIAHLPTLATALQFSALFYQHRRDSAETLEQAEATVALATEQGFTLWIGLGTLVQGWALAQRGQANEGLIQIQQGLAATRAVGTDLARTYLLGMLAEVYGKANQVAMGLAVLSEALDRADKTGERFYEAELYRLKGQLLLNAERMANEKARPKLSDERKTKKKGHASSLIQHSSFSIHHCTEAEACFRKAIALARRQRAKSLELRATVSLARLWQQQGKTAQAQRWLAKIYGCWFTEGFDTVDLKEARALLKELNEACAQFRPRSASGLHR